MSFKIVPTQTNASDVKPEVEFSAGHEREANVIEIIKTMLEDLAQEIGGYVAISASGHVNEVEGLGGDNVNVQINSILPPAAPVEDAGYAAAASSAQNFPPEATTAAPATEDNSPPATQEPNPQPAQSQPEQDAPESSASADGPAVDPAESPQAASSPASEDLTPAPSPEGGSAEESYGVADPPLAPPTNQEGVIGVEQEGIVIPADSAAAASPQIPHDDDLDAVEHS